MKALKNPLLRFFYDYRRYLPGLLLIVGIAMLSGLLKLAASMFWGQTVDHGIAGEISPMLFTAGFMMLIILLDCVRSAVHYYITGRVTEKMFYDVRRDAFCKTAYSDTLAQEKEYRAGDAATKLNSDIDYLSIFVSGYLPDYPRLVFQAVFGIVGCMFICWQLSLALLVIVPLTVWILQKASEPIRDQSRRSMAHVGSAMNIAAESIWGILAVKAFSSEDTVSRHFSGEIQASCGETLKSEKRSAKLSGIRYLSTALQTMLLFLGGALCLQWDWITVGGLLAFISLSSYISDPLSGLDYILLTIRRETAAAQRFYEAIDIKEEPAGPVTHRADDTPVRMEDIAFSYGPEKPGIGPLTLQIEKNHKVALIGSSGCGKSTLLKLICRFYLPGDGSLRLFGAEASDWNPAALREHMALVTQEPLLFHGSIYENIALGKPGLTRKECQEVLEEVGLWDFVESLPEGMDHEIGESGGQLSGGQMQRLCIARAMVRNAPLVLLDEPTSALDAGTESELQEALDRLLQNRSAVIVAHRLATIRNVDYIYCIEDGQVYEEGTPQALLKAKGRYYQMCRAQGLEVECRA